MKITKVLSVLLAMILVFAICPVAANADDYGTSLSELSGSGTQADPYRISSVYDLKTLRHVVNDQEGNAAAGSNKNNCAGLYFVLTADIDLSGESNFIPIAYWGGDTFAFKGRLDGQGHTVKNATITCSGGYYIGLFGMLDQTTISNLTLENINVTGSTYVGALVGRGWNTTYENITIKNCTVSASGSCAGGVIGQMLTGNTLRNVTVDSLTLNAVSNAGGAAGESYGLIEGTVLKGDVTISCSGENVGGVVGIAQSSCRVNDTTVDEAATVRVSSTYTGTYNINVGGIVGRLYGAAINTLTVNGSIIASSARQSAAGIAAGAQNGSSIKNVLVTGSIAASASTNAGAVIGQAENTALVDGVTFTDTSTVVITGLNDGYTSSGGGVIIGTNWQGSFTVQNVLFEGTATVKGGGGDGNGFVVGYCNGGTNKEINIHISGTVNFDCSFWNYGLAAGKVNGGSMDIIAFEADGSVAYTNGNNDSVTVGSIENNAVVNMVGVDPYSVNVTRNGGTVGSNYYFTGNGSASYASKVDSEGLMIDTASGAAIVKDPNAGTELANALAALGYTDIYAHLHDGTGAAAPAMAIEGAKDLLKTVDIGQGLLTVEGNKVTVIGAITANDLEYDSLQMKVTFDDGVNAKNEKNQRIGTVYTTLKGYASTSSTTAAAQGAAFIEDAVYLFGISVIGVPAGTYTVTVLLSGTNSEGQSVGSQICSETLTIA